MEIWEPLPSLIFGIFATFAGVLTFVLPETIGIPLPDTIEESEAIAKYECTSQWKSLNMLLNIV